MMVMNERYICHEHQSQSIRIGLNFFTLVLGDVSSPKHFSKPHIYHGPASAKNWDFWNEALPHGSHLQNITHDKFLVAALSTVRIVLSLMFILLGFSACLYHAMSTILVNKVVPITKDCALPYEADEARR
jgi:hypothetical protein